MLELEGIGNQLERSTQDDFRSDREMSLAMLMSEVDSARADLQNVKNESTKYSDIALRSALRLSSSIEVEGAARRASVELRVLESRIQGAEHRINRFLVEWHKKFAIPFACIVFVLVGAPLAVRFPRGGVGMVIAVSLLIFGIFYISLIAGESLGDRGILSPFWGPWAPNFLFLVIGIWGLARIGRERSTARADTSWGEIWVGLREFFVRPIGRRRAT